MKRKFEFDFFEIESAEPKSKRIKLNHPNQVNQNCKNIQEKVISTQIDKNSIDFKSLNKNRNELMPIKPIESVNHYFSFNKTFAELLSSMNYESCSIEKDVKMRSSFTNKLLEKNMNQSKLFLNNYKNVNDSIMNSTLNDSILNDDSFDELDFDNLEFNELAFDDLLFDDLPADESADCKFEFDQLANDRIFEKRLGEEEAIKRKQIVFENTNAKQIENAYEQSNYDYFMEANMLNQSNSCGRENYFKNKSSSNRSNSAFEFQNETTNRKFGVGMRRNRSLAEVFLSPKDKKVGNRFDRSFEDNDSAYSSATSPISKSNNSSFSSSSNQALTFNSLFTTTKKNNPLDLLAQQFESSSIVNNLFNNNESNANNLFSRHNSIELFNVNEQNEQEQATNKYDMISKPLFILTLKHLQDLHLRLDDLKQWHDNLNLNEMVYGCFVRFPIIGIVDFSKFKIAFVGGLVDGDQEYGIAGEKTRNYLRIINANGSEEVIKMTFISNNEIKNTEFNEWFCVSKEFSHSPLNNDLYNKKKIKMLNYKQQFQQDKLSAKELSHSPLNNDLYNEKKITMLNYKQQDKFAAKSIENDNVQKTESFQNGQFNNQTVTNQTSVFTNRRPKVASNDSRMNTNDLPTIDSPNFYESLIKNEIKSNNENRIDKRAIDSYKCENLNQNNNYQQQQICKDKKLNIKIKKEVDFHDKFNIVSKEKIQQFSKIPKIKKATTDSIVNRADEIKKTTNYSNANYSKSRNGERSMPNFERRIDNSINNSDSLKHQQKANPARRETVNSDYSKQYITRALAKNSGSNNSTVDKGSIANCKSESVNFKKQQNQTATNQIATNQTATKSNCNKSNCNKIRRFHVNARDNLDKMKIKLKSAKKLLKENNRTALRTKLRKIEKLLYGREEDCQSNSIDDIDFLYLFKNKITLNINKMRATSSYQSYLKCLACE